MRDEHDNQKDLSQMLMLLTGFMVGMLVFSGVALTSIRMVDSRGEWLLGELITAVMLGTAIEWRSSHYKDRSGSRTPGMGYAVFCGMFFPTFMLFIR